MKTKKAKEQIGEGYKAAAGVFKVYMVGYMKYEVRNGHTGPVVDTKSNLSDAFTAARERHNQAA